MLQEQNIKPIIIFDGKSLPAKKNIDNKREKFRLNAKNKAVILYKQNHKQFEKEFQKAISVSSQMVYGLIKELKRLNIKHIVSICEADSQLSYMFKNKQIDFVISEDSDLIVFGIKKVFYKMVFYIYSCMLMIIIKQI